MTTSTRLREQIDLDTLSAEPLAVAEQTMQLRQVSLWLRPQVSRVRISRSGCDRGSHWRPAIRGGRGRRLTA